MNKSNQNITFKGSPLKVSGSELKEGAKLPAFKLTTPDMQDLESSAFQGKKLVVCSVPSLDTPVCATETKRFNEEAAKLSDDVEILIVSRDLPFAQSRWCGSEGIESVKTASDYKYRTFGSLFGVEAEEMALLARAVFVFDREGILRHVEYVGEIAAEPQYDQALKALKELD